ERPVGEMLLPRPLVEVRALEQVAEALAVPVPQLLPQHDAPHRSPDEPREPDADRKIEPDDGVGARDDEVAELAVVAPFDHPPRPRDERPDPREEFLGCRLAPVR